MQNAKKAILDTLANSIEVNKMEEIKAISIRQPWVHYIFHCRKDIENRNWKTSHRGRIFIHAAKKPYGRLLTGCLVGAVDIVDCVSESQSKWFMGKYGFVLANPKLLKNPIPLKGQLGIFTLPSDVVQKIYEQGFFE